MNKYAMKFNRRPAPHAPREPLMSLREAEQEFGLSLRQLSGLFSLGHLDPPKPKFRHHAGSGSYYSKRELQEWWLRYQLA